MALDTFGKRLKMLRVDKSLSQIDLRDRMDREHGVKIGESYISELERTNKMPSLEVAAAMAKVLDVSVDYLALLVDEAASYRQPQLPNFMSSEADEVAQLVDAMHPEQRNMILSVVRTIAAPTQRQLKQAELRDTLDSVEAQFGREERIRLERKLNEKRLSFNSAS